MTDLPQEPRVIPSRRCECGCATFSRFEYRGPNVTAFCQDCGAQARTWIPKDAIGMAPPRGIRRDKISDLVRNEVLARYRHRCAWCGRPAYMAALQIGHIIPHGFMKHDFKNIADHPANLAPTCEECNEVAHKIKRDIWDLSLLLYAAVSYAAGMKAGEHGSVRENGDGDAPAVRAPLRGARMGGLPLQGGGKAASHGEGLAFGDDG